MTSSLVRAWSLSPPFCRPYSILAAVPRPDFGCLPRQRNGASGYVLFAPEQTSKYELVEGLVVTFSISNLSR